LNPFQVYYVLNNPPEGWTGGAGFVTKEMIENKLPPSKLAKQVKILLCGPPPMMSIMKKYLEELEFEKCRVISKLDDQVFCTSLSLSLFLLIIHAHSSVHFHPFLGF
jgi:cytochrome-b5 reductase